MCVCVCACILYIPGRNQQGQVDQGDAEVLTGKYDQYKYLM